MIYYQRINGGIFTYDDQSKHVDLLTNSALLKKLWGIQMINAVFFDPKSMKTLKISDEPEKFFLEYLPRVYGIQDKPNTTDDIKNLMKII
jgi:hypothetical protein